VRGARHNLRGKFVDGETNQTNNERRSLT
jgi:hypothetical protein